MIFVYGPLHFLILKILLPLECGIFLSFLCTINCSEHLQCKFELMLLCFKLVGTIVK